MTPLQMPPLAVVVDGDGDLSMVAALDRIIVVPGVTAYAVAEVWTCRVSSN